MSQGQTSHNLVLDKKFFGGKLFTSLGRFEKVLKSDIWSPFQPKDLNVKEFSAAA